MNPIQLARGNPSPTAIPYELIDRAASVVLQRHRDAINRYGTALGFAPLREQLAIQHNCPVDRVMLGNGAMNLFGMLIAHFVTRREHVFTATPTYDFALMVIRQQTQQVHGIPLEADGINVDALENKLQHVQPRFLYLIPDFQNPTGATTSLEKRKAILALAEKHGFTIIEDAAYRHLRYTKDQIPTFYEMNPERVVYLSSFSKIAAPGLRTGYMLASPEVITPLTRHASLAHIFPNTYSEAVIFELLQQPEFPDHLATIRREYGQRLKTLQASLAELPPDAYTYPVEGGFFVGVFWNKRVPNFLEIAEANGVLCLDGDAFFTTPPQGLFLRIAFASLSDTQAEQVGARLKNTFEER